MAGKLRQRIFQNNNFIRLQNIITIPPAALDGICAL
jgi:hypothetical protein